MTKVSDENTHLAKQHLSLDNFAHLVLNDNSLLSRLLDEMACRNVCAVLESFVSRITSLAYINFRINSRLVPLLLHFLATRA